jgi:hypothetical protein
MMAAYGRVSAFAELSLRRFDRKITSVEQAANLSEKRELPPASWQVGNLPHVEIGMLFFGQF